VDGINATHVKYENTILAISAPLPLKFPYVEDGGSSNEHVTTTGRPKRNVANHKRYSELTDDETDKPLALSATNRVNALGSTNGNSGALRRALSDRLVAATGECCELVFRVQL